MIVIVISVSIILFALFLLAGKQTTKKTNSVQNSTGNPISSEPVQKRGANLYSKPMDEFNDVEFDRFAQTVEMRYRVRERYDK